MSLYVPSHRFSRRSLLAGLGGTAAGATLLSACGSASGGGSSSAFGQPAGEVPAEFSDRLRIVVWTSLADSRGVAFQEIVDQFNESQTEIFVENQFQGELSQKVTAGIGANEVADLLYLGSGAFANFYLSDVLEPLDDYFGDGFAKEDYNPIFLEEGQVRDQTYWVPFARSTTLMYYNKTVYEEAGLGDQAPTTWDEVREWGDAVKGLEYNGNPVTFQGYSDQDGDWQFQGMLWQWGAGFSDGFDITVDSEAAIEAAEYSRALIHDDANAYMANEIVADFTNGLVATAVMSTASLRGLRDTVDFDLGAAFVPTHVDSGVALGGGGFSITKGVPQDRKDASFEFLRYLATPEIAAQWTANTGYIITTAAAAETDLYKKTVEEDPYFSLAFDQLDRARTSDDVKMWIPEASGRNWESISRMWADNTDPVEEMTTLAADLRELVEENKALYEDRVA